MTHHPLNVDFQIAEYRLALGRITQHYPPDTIAGRLAADILAKYPNRFENADRENDSEPSAVPEIEGLPHGPEASHHAELVEAIERIRDEANTVCGDWRETASMIDSICLATLNKFGGSQ